MTEWRVKRRLIPDGYVFTISMPASAKILSVITSKRGQWGKTHEFPQPYFLVLRDVHDSNWIERTFVLLTEDKEVSPEDAELICSGVMVPLGEFTLSIKTFYVFEDTSAKV